jgi:sugar phosphate isomerase/epimerase
VKLSLSTNWCASRVESGEEIVDIALSLGFDSLELGFATTAFQAEGFRRRRGEMPVGSVHAFCPVPISAPHGSPELYALATADADASAIARFHVLKSARFAAEMGAGAVVLHAGRVGIGTLFNRNAGTESLFDLFSECGSDPKNAKFAKAVAKALALRRKRGRALVEPFVAVLETIATELESLGVVLALENLPYLEGFPDEIEMLEIAKRLSGSPVKAWFDTGHDRVRQMRGWLDDAANEARKELLDGGFVAGMHLNDVKDYFDDHFAPGDGAVDFASFATLAANVGHVVFEPKSHVSAESLAAGLARIRDAWHTSP